MERNFTNENFERFLRQNSEGLRMQPSDKVWKGISKHINQRRRRFGFFLGISLLITTSTGYYLVENKSANSKGTNPDNITEQINRDIITKTEPAVEQAENFTSPENIISKGSQNNSISISRFKSASQQSAVQLMSSAANQETTSEVVIAQKEFIPTVIDDTYPKNLLKNEEAATTSQVIPVDPLTIESVVNSYTPKKKNKIGLQIYFTPTVSYRKLSENKAYMKTVAPANIPSSQQGLYDINNAVTHKPDFGFEVGLTAKYPVSKNLKLRAGVQFNVNRYDIKVFNSSTQVATIRFNDRNRVDSVNTISTYSNVSGYKSDWLQNFYFQVSAPVGVELTLKGDEKVQFGIASTVQPTYVLGDRAYLISSDHKNYAEVPWLIRRWNVNTSLETFVSYSTGQLKWQVGPQVRYQLLSSFVKKYPVKENLFDFGLKVGVSLNNNK